MGGVFGGIAGIFGGDAAADKMSQHLAQIKGVDIDALVKAAKDRDTAKFSEQLDVLAKADPTFASLREGGAQALMDFMAKDKDSASTRAVSSLEDLATANGEDTQSIIDSLIGKAKAEFAQGANLPPEIQAELVRTGLEEAGTAGENLDPTSAAGVRIRRLVGTEGLNLQRNREQAALGFLSAADQVRNQRASILSSLIGANEGVTGAAANRAAGAVSIGQAAVPNIGVTGHDVGGLMQQNQQLLNDVQLMRGKNASGEAASKWANIGSIGSSVAGGLAGSGLLSPGIAGAIGGMASGGAPTGGGGGGGGASL